MRAEEMVHEKGQLGSAWFSTCRQYRYLLLRGGTLVDVTPLVTFVMLNPSTADADKNDPTITRCVDFAARFSEGVPHRVAIVNLFAYRAADPDVCFAAPDPVGKLNNEVLIEVCYSSRLVIAAWGADARSKTRADWATFNLRDRGVLLYHLGSLTKGGHPRHPLYLSSSTSLEVWR